MARPLDQLVDVSASIQEGDYLIGYRPGDRGTRVTNTSLVSYIVGQLGASFAPVAHTQLAVTIEDSTPAGRTLLTSVDAAAQRSALGLGGAALLPVGTTGGTVAAGDDARFLSSPQKAELIGGASSTLHFHSTDRDRSNHTGTQSRSTISDFAHQTTHAPNGSDPFPWTTAHGYGTTAAKPAASASNSGYLYFDTDLQALQRSNGTAWVTLLSGTITPQDHLTELYLRNGSTLAYIRFWHSGSDSDPQLPFDKTGTPGVGNSFDAIYLKNADTGTYIQITVTGSDDDPVFNFNAVGTPSPSNSWDALYVSNVTTGSFIMWRITGTDADPVLTFEVEP